MTVKVMNQYAQEMLADVESFKYSNYSNTLELFFTSKPDTTIKQLLTQLGFRQSGWCTVMWEIPTSQISSISSAKL